MHSGNGTGPQRGVLVDWNDARGFGFITPAAGGTRVFVHISAFPPRPRPVTGCAVTYVEGRDERNRRRALRVWYAAPGRAGNMKAGGVLLASTAVVLFFALLAGLAVQEPTRAVLVAICGVFSIAAFVLYGVDKSAARQGIRRTPESTLHTIALLGGWPGALIARQVFRHKTVKQPFRTIFWGTVAVNCAAIAWLAYEAPFTLP